MNVYSEPYWTHMTKKMDIPPVYRLKGLRPLYVCGVILINAAFLLVLAIPITAIYRDPNIKEPERRILFYVLGSFFSLCELSLALVSAEAAMGEDYENRIQNIQCGGNVFFVEFPSYYGLFHLVPLDHFNKPGWGQLRLTDCLYRYRRILDNNKNGGR